MKTFYRVNHEQTKQGLWYRFNGEFSGLIHNQFNFCQNKELKMGASQEEFINQIKKIWENIKR
jgi:hypothetical protein